LQAHDTETADAYQQYGKEVMTSTQAVITKLYASQMPPGATNPDVSNAPNATTTVPTIEEVD